MIIPVILEETLEAIEEKIRVAEQFAPLIQVDFAESSYVEGSTYLDIDRFGAIATHANLELDLMVKDPTGFIDKKYKNVQKVCAYLKQTNFVPGFSTKMRSFGYQCGIAIGPETNTNFVDENLELVDYVQFYTVIPGGKGREFIPEAAELIKAFHQKYPNVRIQVDGGINQKIIPSLHQAGVTDFVIGSSIFKASHPHQAFIQLSNMLEASHSKTNIKEIAILGGAAWKETDQPYIDAYNTAKLLAENGYEIVNGGGPGVMRASTKGAHAGKGRVLAVTYHPNKPKRHYEGVDPENDFDVEVITLDYFDRTKVMLQTTQAHIVFKGSIGTLSEFGMSWISSWIHEPNNKPIILFGESWNDFLKLVHKDMLIVRGEEKFLKVATTPEEVLAYLKSLEQ